MTSIAEPNMPDEATAPSVRSQRFQWLDNLRGFALLCMASYHFTWDLAFFQYIDSDFPTVGWPKVYARTIASTFLFLAGFSLVLAHGDQTKWSSFWKRFGMIAGAATAISVLTLAGSVLMGSPEFFIYFGILHEMALASLVGLLFLRVPWPLTAGVGAFFIVVANDADLLQRFQLDVFNAPWFWWIGLSVRPRNSIDIVPVFPWLGPFLLGIALARIDVILNWLRRNARSGVSMLAKKTPFAFLGRHALAFYLLHQLVLFPLVYVFSLVVPPPTVAPEEKYIGSCERSCTPQQGEKFCKAFCACTLERLQQTKLLAPFQSGAMSAGDDQRLKGIANECTLLSE